MTSLTVLFRPGSRIGAQQLVERKLLGPVDSQGRLAQLELLTYAPRREERLAAVVNVTAADAPSGVPYR